MFNNIQNWCATDNPRWKEDNPINLIGWTLVEDNVAALSDTRYCLSNIHTAIWCYET